MRSPEACANVEDVRGAIDELDREVLRLLGRRADYVAAAARFKTDQGSVRAPDRQKAVMASRRRWAEEENLDPDFVERLYGSIVSHFVAREMARWEDDHG